MTALAQKTCAENQDSLQPPDIDANAPLDDIVRLFFKHDFICIRNMLPRARVDYFCETYLKPIYAEDDLKIADGFAGLNAEEERQLKGGWIMNSRLQHITNKAVVLEDVLLTRLYIRLADKIMGCTNWRGGGSTCYTRRMHAKPTPGRGYSSAAPWHVDALWFKDKEYTLNFWVPFTECGKYSPGLQFVLSSPDEIKQHCHYDPFIPDEPRGPYNTIPRLDFHQFSDQAYDAAFGPEKRWAPELNPGDILLFSNWAPHRTWFPEQTQNERISLEYRLYSSSPDTPSREEYSV